MKRRALLIAPLALAATPALASGGGGGAATTAGFVRYPTITATTIRADGRRGVMTVETGVDAPNAALKLRVYIQGGGCSGFQYGFEFDEGCSEDDFAIVTDGVTLLVDPLSLQYLAGAEVDYSESLQGAQFVIRNPNAKTTCGCGSSFTV